VMGSADHVVALGGDLAGNAVDGLAPGEFGLSDGTNMVLFQGGILKLIAPTKVRIESPRLECTGEVVGNCDGPFVTLTQHKHPSNGAPPEPNT